MCRTDPDRYPHPAAKPLRPTCKMNDVDPYAWAKLTLERIANRWPNNDVEALMPWNFKLLD